MLNIALNALDALIFVSTVSTFNAKHSIKCIGCFDLCIDSVDKQDTVPYSIHKFIGCFDLCINSVDI